MGIGDFWLKPYNKKTLDEFNGDIKRQDLSSKFDALFNVWDKDKSGKLEANEVSSIFNQIAESERVDDQEFLGEIFTKVSKSNANDLAKRFFKIAEDNESNKSMKEFQKFLDEEITADNILDLLDAYDNPDIKKQDSSLIDTVVSEKLLSGDKTTQKKVLLTILDKVCEAARKYGVAEDDINNARKDFEDSIKEEYDSLSSMFRMADSLKMERAIDFLRGAILIKQNQVKDVDSKDAMLTVTEQFYSDNETAYDEFNIERSATANFGDWVCGLFGCKTLDDMKSKLDMNVEGANELLTALVNEDEEAFKVAYKKLFGIEFDPQKIAAAQELSEKVSAIQMLTSNLQVFEEIKNSSNLEEILKEKFKYSDEVIEEIIKDYPAENKDESLKLFIEESFNNAKDMILELSDGKTVEQLENDVELATKSAYGDNDISKEIAKFNQNMVLTEAFADSAFEIVGTIALTMIPVVGQLGAAALAARTAKMGSNMVKVTNMLRKTSVAMYKANKFQQGSKYTSKVKNYGTRVGATMGNTAVATAGVNIYTEKDIKTILQKTIMNSAFSWVGATSNTLSPILMKQFGISSQLATDLAEEILNVAGSYGVTKANGADYTQTDAFVDLATGLIFARIAGGSGRNVETSTKAEVGIKKGVDFHPTKNTSNIASTVAQSIDVQLKNKCPNIDTETLNILLNTLNDNNINQILRSNNPEYEANLILKKIKNFDDNLQLIGVIDIDERNILSKFMFKTSNWINSNVQADITKSQLDFIRNMGANSGNTYVLAPQPKGTSDFKSYTNAARNLIEISHDKDVNFCINPEHARVEFRQKEGLNLFEPNEMGKKFVVISDDCSISGASLIEDVLLKLNPGNNLKTGQDIEIIFMPTVLSEKARENINRFIDCFNKISPEEITSLEHFIKINDLTNLSKNGQELYEIIKDVTDNKNVQNKVNNIIKSIKNYKKNSGGKINFTLADVSSQHKSQLAQDYRQTEYYKNLPPEEQSTIDLWLTTRGQSFGYHQCATSVSIEGYQSKGFAFNKYTQTGFSRRALGIQENGIEHPHLPIRGNAPNNNHNLAQIFAKSVGVNSSRIKFSGLTSPETYYNLLQKRLVLTINNDNLLNNPNSKKNSISMSLRIKKDGTYDGKITIMGKEYDAGSTIEIYSSNKRFSYKLILPKLEEGVELKETLRQYRESLNVGHIEEGRISIVHGMHIIDENYNKPFKNYTGQHEKYMFAIPDKFANDITIKINGEVVLEP